MQKLLKPFRALFAPRQKAKRRYRTLREVSKLVAAYYQSELSQQEFAEICGVHQSTVSRWLHRVRPCHRRGKKRYACCCGHR